MMEVVEYSADDWKNFSEDAHLAVFAENRSKELNRIDFALLLVDDDIPQMYMTCREYDAESLYLNYGGAFPSINGSPRSVQGFLCFLKYLSQFYIRATLLTENTNKAMLKLAMKVGFEIIGLRNFDGGIYLEHLLDLRSLNG